MGRVILDGGDIVKEHLQDGLKEVGVEIQGDMNQGQSVVLHLVRTEVRLGGGENIP